MQIRNTALAVLFTVALPVLVPAAALEVVELEGRVEALRGRDWTVVDRHEELDEDVTAVRLGAGSELVLRQGERLLWLNRRGAYRADELFAHQELLYSAGVPELLEQTLFNVVNAVCAHALPMTVDYLAAELPDAEAAVELPELPELPERVVEWPCRAVAEAIDDTGLLQLVNAVTAAAERRPVSASIHLDGALESLAEGSELHAAALLTAAYVARLNNDLPGAYAHIEAISDPEFEPLAEAYALLHGAMLLEQAAYGDAITELNRFIHDEVTDTRHRATGYVLLGAAYYGLGNTGAARRALDEALAVSDNSLSAQVASRLAAAL